jgi:hypothetical protein
LEELHERYADRVEFVAVYVREAHPGDGAWPMGYKTETGDAINQPTAIDQRVDVACQCCKTLEIFMPLLVDGVDDRVGRAYSGMPDRLYVIDRDGKVVYKGGRGPFGFKPGEMEQSLMMLLLDAMGEGAVTVAAGE